MVIRFQKYIYFRFAILALLAAFSLSANADYIWSVTGGQCPSSSAEASAQCATPADYHYGYVTYSSDSLATPHWFRNSDNLDRTLGMSVIRSGTGCDSPAVWNSSLHQCVVPATCTAPKVLNSATNECVWPTSCPAGQSLLSMTSAGGGVTSASCVPNIETPDQPCLSYADNQTAYCKNKQNDCTATGGKFGIINGKNVCIPPGSAANPPTCASGGTQFTANADGSSSVNCIGVANIGNLDPSTPGQTIMPGTTASTPTAQQQANIANNTAATAQISLSGFQAVVNAINNKTSAGGGAGSSAGQDQTNTAGIISAINAAKDSEHGAGTCDPHAANYSECVGQTETAPDNDGSTANNSAISLGNASIDSAADGVVAGIENSAAQAAPSSSGVVSTLLSYMPQSESCSDWSTTMHGVNFSIHCTETDTFREWAAWVLSIMTMYAIFQIMFRRVA